MNTTEYRNIAEQVLKNKEDILKHFQKDRVLADFGITIIGQVDTAAELPTHAENYGDAYAVGSSAPFDYYIWTRANNISPVDYWFDFGQITIAGPQGPKGDKGDKGNDGDSTKWYYGDVVPYIDASVGSFYLHTISGNVYYKNERGWGIVGNIRGAQGAQGVQGVPGPIGETGPVGRQGPQGDPGRFIKIYGTTLEVENLPSPVALNDMSAAYLVGLDPFFLYIQVGENPNNAVWTNVGIFNAATAVYQNGNFATTFNADTKVDKITGSGERAYVSVNGADTSRVLTDSAVANTLVRRDTGKTFKIGEPTVDSNPATKKYVDDKYNNSPLSVPLHEGPTAYSIIQKGPAESTITDGRSQVVFGEYNTVSGGVAPIIGGFSNNVQNLDSSIVMGETNEIAGGYNSIYVGANISSDYPNNETIAVGKNLLVREDNKAVFGYYNLGNSGNVVEVGGGDSTARKNLLEVRSNGLIKASRDITDEDSDYGLVTKGYLRHNFLYEYETRNIPYEPYNVAADEITTLVFDKYYNGVELDIMDMVISGYVNIEGQGCYFSQNITRQLQGVQPGSVAAFKISGLFNPIATDNLRYYTFLVNIKLEQDGKFYMTCCRLVHGTSLQGYQMSATGTLSGITTRTLCAKKIKVIND